MRSIADAIETRATMAEAQACVIRDVAHHGKSVVVPIEGGVEVDELTPTILTKPADPRFRVRITEAGYVRKIEAFYRHPMTAKVTTWRLKQIKTKCGL